MYEILLQETRFSHRESGRCLRPGRCFQWLLLDFHEGHIFPKANLQDLGVSPGELEFIKIRMNDSDDPISSYQDPALGDPDLMQTVPTETARRLLMPRCPACRGRPRQHAKATCACDKSARLSSKDLLPPPLAKAPLPTKDSIPEEIKDQLKDKFIENEQETSSPLGASSSKPMQTLSPANSVTLRRPSSWTRATRSTSCTGA